VRAFVFSIGNTRFGVHLPPTHRQEWMAAASQARDEFRQTWDDAQADILIDQCYEWALVYNCMVTKTQPHPDLGFCINYIFPWDFGVSREDVPDLGDQDTICHWYTLSIPQFNRWVRQEKQASALLDTAREHAKPGKVGNTNNRLVVAQVSGVFPSGQVSGGFPGDPSESGALTAEVEEKCVELVDLWERKLYRYKGEEFEDWRVTTKIAGTTDAFLAQRRNPDVPYTKKSLSQVLHAELPFHLIVPNPMPDYLWGRSEVENLTGLQDWCEEHLSKVRAIIARQLDPSTFFSGVTDVEEAGRAMSTVGGYYSSPEPGAKRDAQVPPLTQQTMEMFKLQNEMFGEQSGLPGSLNDPGTMPGGVRATGHFSMAAGIGARRIVKKALLLENTLGEIATTAFHILQRNNTDAYTSPDGKKFLLSHLPSAIRLKVNAHSSAPIFGEQTQAKAAALMKAGAITKKRFVNLIDPPNADECEFEAERLQESQAEMQKELMQVQHEKATKTKK